MGFSCWPIKKPKKISSCLLNNFWQCIHHQDLSRTRSGYRSRSRCVRKHVCRPFCLESEIKPEMLKYAVCLGLLTRPRPCHPVARSRPPFCHHLFICIVLDDCWRWLVSTVELEDKFNVVCNVPGPFTVGFKIKYSTQALKSSSGLAESVLALKIAKQSALTRTTCSVFG